MNDFDKKLLKICKIGNIEVIEYLISQTSDTYTKKFALIAAIKNRRFEVVKYLISQEVKVDTDALVWAHFFGNINIFFYLLFNYPKEGRMFWVKHYNLNAHPKYYQLIRGTINEEIQ